jgi:hypothetical protein
MQIILCYWLRKIDRLIEIGRCSGMAKNVDKTLMLRISVQPSPVQIMIDKKMENVEYFNYLSSMITTHARYTREIKSSIAMRKAAFSKKTLFTSELDLYFRKKLCMVLKLGHFGN